MAKVRVYGIEEVIIDDMPRERAELIGEIDGPPYSPETYHQIGPLIKNKYESLDKFAAKYRKMRLEW